MENQGTPSDPGPVPGSLEIKHTKPEMPDLCLVNMALDEAVYTTVGAASVCWEDMSGKGVFQEDLARSVADQLIEFIRDQKQNAMEAAVRNEKVVAGSEGKLLLDLINFGEWLDSEGLTKVPAKGDNKSHEDLAKAFLESRSG